jgi:hypothetical protein
MSVRWDCASRASSVFIAASSGAQGARPIRTLWVQ